MAKYRIETTGGVYEVETEELKPGSPEWAQERNARIEANHERYTKDKPKEIDMSVAGLLEGAGNAVNGLWEAGKRLVTPPEDTRGRVASMIAGPAGPLLSDMLMGHVETGQKALAAAKDGRYSEAAGYGLATALPVVGPMAAGMGEKLGDGKVSEVAGELLAGAAVPKVAKGAMKVATKAGRAEIAVAGTQAIDKVKTTMVGPPNPVVQMTQALRPKSTKTNFGADVDRAMPELKVSESALGRPIASVGDVIEAVKIAKERVWSQVEQAMGPQMQASLDASPIADAIQKSVPSKIRLEDPRAAAAILDVADKYRRTFTVQELETLLQDTNAKLESHYGKYPGQKRSALRSNPEVAHDVAMAEATRDLINKWIDQPGQGAGMQELKRRYGSLRSIEEEAYRRKNVADRQAPQSLNQQMSKVQAAGEMARGLFRGMHGDIVGAGADFAKASAMKHVSNWMRQQFSTDGLIERAFREYNGAPTPVKIQPFRPKALLGSGPIITPPPADPSGITVTTGAALRPQPFRPKGLLGAGPIVTPPPADPSGVFLVRGKPYLPHPTRELPPGR